MKPEIFIKKKNSCLSEIVMNDLNECWQIKSTLSNNLPSFKAKLIAYKLWMSTKLMSEQEQLFIIMMPFISLYIELYHIAKFKLLVTHLFQVNKKNHF